MTEKVKLPKEVAEAIEWCRNYQGYTNYDILQRYLDDTFSNTYAVVIKDFANYESNFDILLKALVNGYEVEQTPEEKVKELYDYFDQGDVAFHGKDVQNKIGLILTELGHKIGGVNA